jgi:hypothetical protein
MILMPRVIRGPCADTGLCALAFVAQVPGTRQYPKQSLLQSFGLAHRVKPLALAPAASRPDSMGIRAVAMTHSRATSKLKPQDQ